LLYPRHKWRGLTALGIKAGQEFLNYTLEQAKKSEHFNEDKYAEYTEFKEPN